MPPLPQPLGFLPPHSVPRSVAELASRAGPLPLCADNGNLDMYGLGIRLAFYIQWYTLIACYLFQRVAEIHTVRLALNCFLSANFLALLIQTGRKVLSPIDTYITLVLYFGFYLSSIPVFMWRLLTRFDPAFDPTRWHLVRISKLDKAFHRVLVVSAAGFQLYFWTTVVPFADLDKCISHGFFLTKMPLDSDTLRTINTAAQVLVGFIYVFSPVVASLISENTHQGDTASLTSSNLRDKYRISRGRLRILMTSHAVVFLITATFVVVGAELAIRWNQLGGVQDLGTSGQLIPLLVGVGTPMRVVYLWQTGSSQTSNPSAGNRSRSKSRGRSRTTPEERFPLDRFPSFSPPRRKEASPVQVFRSKDDRYKMRPRCSSFDTIQTF